MLSVRRIELATGTGLALLDRRLVVCGEAPTLVRFTREFILPPVWSERIFSLSRSDPAERDLVQNTRCRIADQCRLREEFLQAHTLGLDTFSHLNNKTGIKSCRVFAKIFVKSLHAQGAFVVVRSDRGRAPCKITAVKRGRWGGYQG